MVHDAPGPFLAKVPRSGGTDRYQEAEWARYHSYIEAGLWNVLYENSRQVRSEYGRAVCRHPFL